MMSTINPWAFPTTTTRIKSCFCNFEFPLSAFRIACPFSLEFVSAFRSVFFPIVLAKHMRQLDPCTFFINPRISLTRWHFMWPCLPGFWWIRWVWFPLFWATLINFWVFRLIRKWFFRNCLFLFGGAWFFRAFVRVMQFWWDFRRFRLFFVVGWAWAWSFRWRVRWFPVPWKPVFGCVCYPVLR